VLEGAGVRRWTEATPAQRDRVRASLADYTEAVRGGGASYQQLNAQHLSFHVSLVGLTGSPRLVAMAEALVLELRLALAQAERLRRNAHDEAETHSALVALLDADDVSGAAAFLVEHLAAAEVSIIDALGLDEPAVDRG